MESIVFYDEGGVPFNGETIHKKPLAGSESAICYMAKEFSKKGINATVYNNCEEEGEFDGVTYLNRKKFEKNAEKGFDVFVAQRGLTVFLNKFGAKTKIFWMQDNPNGVNYWKELNSKLAPALNGIDAIFPISNFQKNALLENFPFASKKKIIVTRNGVDLEKIEKARSEKTCFEKFVYTTTPFRGLDVLLKIWPEIKRDYPAGELHIYGGMKVYQMDEEPFMQLYSKAETMEGVFVHGAFSQQELFRIISDSFLYLYPNTFEETGCISLMESISLGIPAISSMKGALPETVRKGCGALISGDPHSLQYAEQFVKETLKLCESKSEWKKMRKRCLKQDYSWKTVAKEWIDAIESMERRAKKN